MMVAINLMLMSMAILAPLSAPGVFATCTSFINMQHMRSKTSQMMESTVNNETVHNLMVPETKPSVTNTYKPETDSTLIDEMNHEFRFGGVDRLYRTRVGQKSGSEELDPLALLRESTVVVVGLGGVGSWAAEALCRSGIGHLVLVDLDDICISNTNRQMHTSSSSVGKFKIDVLASRFRDISPLCHVTCIHDFVSSDNVHEILDQIQNVTQKIDDGRVRSITAVLDAIDGAKEKAALIAACTDAKIPVVTCGGAAGLLDPTKIVCDDLTRVADDKLLTACRTNLRKYHNFAPGLPFHQRTNTKTWKLPAIYSTETACDAVPVSSDSPRLQVCDSGLGTACFVTGAFGFTAAAQIVSGIAQNTLKPPRRS